MNSILFITDMGNYFVTKARLNYYSKTCNMKNVQIENNVQSLVTEFSQLFLFKHVTKLIAIIITK